MYSNTKGSSMKKAVAKGNLKMGPLTLAVSMYVGTDEFALQGHIYHKDDDGPIGIVPFCKLCAEENPAVYNAIAIDETNKIEITTEDRNVLLERNLQNWHVVSAHRISDLANFMIQGNLLPHRIYELKPQQQIKGLATQNDLQFSLLLQRLSAKRRFLLLEIPSGLKRYAILLTDSKYATLISLYYMEEVRIWDEPVELQMKVQSKAIDDLILSYDADFPLLSNKLIIDKVNKWLNMRVTGRKIEANEFVAIKEPAN